MYYGSYFNEHFIHLVASTFVAHSNSLFFRSIVCSNTHQHQKHTPLIVPMMRSLTPRRCNARTARMYSILFCLTWLRNEAEVTASLTISLATSASGTVMISLSHRSCCNSFVFAQHYFDQNLQLWGCNFKTIRIIPFSSNCNESALSRK